MVIATLNRDEVLALARRLTPADQAYVVAQLAPTIADALDSSAAVAPAADDPWQRLDQLREEFRALGPAPISATEQLLRDRQSRDATLCGRHADDDVHA